MERLVEIKIAKFNILSILDYYCRLFPLIYISYDPKGIIIQGFCKDREVLATTVIPRDSLESYECKETALGRVQGPLVVAVPLHPGKLDGKCVSIEVLEVDSWRVKSVFKSNNGVSYEAVSSYIFELANHPAITEGISLKGTHLRRSFYRALEIPKGRLRRSE